MIILTSNLGSEVLAKKPINLSQSLMWRQR